MFKERKEYRKKFNATGQLYVGGETLSLSCYDVSVKGAMLEIIPGELLATIEDFEALIGENRRAEIYVEDLMMSGEVDIVWVKQEHNHILMGVEFLNVVHNANKLWRKRRNYRKEQPFSAELIVEKDHFQVEGINCSKEGVCLRMMVSLPSIKKDTLVKLKVQQFALNAFGKIMWVKHDGEITTLGLQIITLR
ncbi:MAG: PilZ domain-containing protein [Methylococcaceae bacterium]|nr:PilZ domain-containing protein [Methylococcaceae bacterium]